MYFKRVNIMETLYIYCIYRYLFEKDFIMNRMRIKSKIMDESKHDIMVDTS